LDYETADTAAEGTALVITRPLLKVCYSKAPEVTYELWPPVVVLLL